MPPPADRQQAEKQLVAQAAVSLMQDGMQLAVGSGSTVAAFLQALGQAVRTTGLRVQATLASRASEQQARAAGIPIQSPQRGLRFDLCLDGADELDGQLQLIKGGGGALLREKVLATAAAIRLILADSSKLVPALGRFPLPLEVVPFALPWVLDAVAALGADPHLRVNAQDQPVLSDQANYLVDAAFGLIAEPAVLAMQLQAIPGLVAHGLFLGLADAALLAHEGHLSLLRPGQPPLRVEHPQQLPALMSGLGRNL
ncbi:ribose-5-phosphate isomerase RpiA [Hymenobacter sp. 15J16-1T3B]|uniref:ribose-5-phosphate isomerase RpiA n=1 Tax=Hymenobacter sp. 15J16-1T3B TaxID=2886941 RepID=UPI001D0FDAC7|nr:ribose-5-phosphate isomerase RpiA [Hymenobacter sp. 15J16-1T3B]MCC3158685.1 ribose-5-phosphate isomerase RpiA [Hymenobacter sp. 15J16-1T3B]